MWTEEQKSAIDKRNSNVLVSASAGSGKTAVLINRVINRVIDEEIDIDKILVVTFTNAAALKLKDELLARLKKEYSTNIAKRGFIRKQIKLLNVANISTIHAFCLDLIRANFDIVGIDPDFKICDESKINIYKAKALNQVLEEEYSRDENKLLYLLLELFNHKEDELSYELLKIYNYIQSFEMPLEWLKVNIDKYDNFENIDDLIQTEFGKSIYLDALEELKLLVLKIDYNLKSIKIYDDFNKIVDILIDYKSRIEDVINSSSNWDTLYEKIQNLELKNLPSYKGTMLEKKEEIAAFKKNILKSSIDKLKKIIYGDTSTIIKDNKSVYKYLNYIYEILCKFDETYKKIKLSKNVIDFSDIEHLAYELLIKDGKKTDVALALEQKFAEIYTDEYQDTSVVQEAILDIISSGNNRFMVGDIKQSIYRFRQASPEIFNYKALTYKKYNGDNNLNEDTKIILAKNFRSRKEVIDFVNLIFEKIMTMKAGNADYSGEEILKCGKDDLEKDEFYNTKINIIDLKTKETDELADEIKEETSEDINLIEELKDFEIESKFIAKDIEELVKDKTKDVKYKDIVILLRNVTNRADILEKALKDRNIPVFSDISSSVFDSEEIKLVLAFLRILDNKYQDVYLASIMYSIIGKFSLDELIKIRDIDKKCDLYSCLVKFISTSQDNELVQKTEKFLDLISTYEKLIKNLTISEVLIKLFRDTGIYYEFILDENYKQRKANLDLVLDLTLKYENENGSFLNEYIDYIDNLSSKTDASSMQAKVIGENEDVVRIMTIHKSKGLEFPIVILADTSRKYNQMEFKNMIYLHHDLGIGINIVNDAYKVSYPGLIKHAIRNSLENEAKSEELRLLYVALTRAMNKLIIYGTTKDYFKLKADLFIMQDGTKIDSYTVLKNDSYLKNILMALEVSQDEEKSLYELNVINAGESLKDFSDENRHIDLIETIKKEKSNFSKEEIEKEIENIKSDNIEKIIQFQEDDVMQRVSVTRLKKGEESISKILENVLPSCLIDEKQHMNAARKGTLIHFILQILDFSKTYSKQDLISFIDECIKSNVILENERKYINVEDIIKFLNSDIGVSLKNSKFINKEKEFILKNNSFTKSTIQGVIDLYYETSDGKIILIDFKTDNILEEGKFVELYKKQLDIYQEAIEKLEGKKVDKKYIYSFRLGKKIEVV